MDPREERQRLLIEELRARGDWVTARELSARLGVSTRSVRDYVRQLNRDAGAALVASDQAGYRLDPVEYRRYRAKTAKRREGYDTPQQRLYYIARSLVNQAEGADVFELGEQLSVSPATIEADLGRARELFRDHQLSIVRDRDTVRISGPERRQRQLVRHLLLATGGSGMGARMSDFENIERRSRMRDLHRLALAGLERAGVEMNEFALNDLLVHMAIAAERTQSGHELGLDAVVPASETDPLWTATQALGDAVQEVYRISLPGADLATVHDILATRSNLALPDGAEPAIGERAMTITRDALHTVSRRFLLDLYDEATISGLSLHVANLIARSEQGRNLDTPLGPTFRNMHPLIHELALAFCQEIERQAAVTITEGEVDFLAFHLGNQIQRQMTQGAPITITCVAPRYGELHERLKQRLVAALGDQAVITQTVTALSHDWENLASDLVVSMIDLDEVTTIPVIQVSPFLTDDDLDRIIRAVRLERDRAGRAKLRASVLALLDPALFHHVSDAGTQLDVLTLMTNAMVAEGYADDRFLADVLDRERRSSTSFGGGFAIPHTLYMDADRTGIGVLISDTPIMWGESRQVRLVLMFSISQDGRAIFRDVLDGLIGVLNEPSNIATLLEHSCDHHQFVRCLVGLLDG